MGIWNWPAVGVLGFERELGLRLRTLRDDLVGWPSLVPGLRSGVGPWTARVVAELDRSPEVLTCSDSFSRDGLALFSAGGRTSGSLGRRPAVGKRLDNADAERSESDGSETIEDAEALCFAGLLISRLKSRCPLASRSLKADDFKGLVAEKEREVWSVRAGGIGL